MSHVFSTTETLQANLGKRIRPVSVRLRDETSPSLEDQVKALRVAVRGLLAEARPHVRPDLIVAAEHALEISEGFHG